MQKQELTIKSQRQLQYYCDLILAKKFGSIFITNKKTNLDSLEVAEKIRKIRSDLSITLNYSLVNNYSDSTLKVFEKLKFFLNKSKELKIEEILLLSGHPKRKIDTLVALEFIQTQGLLLDSKISIAVAFNPFLEDLEEMHRLEKKLSYSMVNSVYFQLGDDLDLIQKGIELVRKFRKEIQIWQSILTPNPVIIQSLKFRPWYGVKFSEKFLQSVHLARECNERIVYLAKTNGCNLLVG